MRTVYNKIIPFRGFLAINLFGVMFVREENRGKVGAVTQNHEAIHTAQMRELGYIGFYILYLLEWICRLIFHTSTAYVGISFEREAYAHQRDCGYLETRRHFEQWRKK